MPKLQAELEKVRAEKASLKLEQELMKRSWRPISPRQRRSKSNFKRSWSTRMFFARLRRTGWQAYNSMLPARDRSQFDVRSAWVLVGLGGAWTGKHLGKKHCSRCPREKGDAESSRELAACVSDAPKQRLGGARTHQLCPSP